HLSFKAAADELSLTPTAISHQIRLLESVVGRDLFRRRPRPLTLTSVGAALLPTVRSSFDSIAEALASACKETTSRPPAPRATAASSLIGDPRDDEVKVTARLAARANPDAMSRSQPASDPADGTLGTASPPRLSLVVLPFAAIAADHEQEYF